MQDLIQRSDRILEAIRNPPAAAAVLRRGLTIASQAPPHATLAWESLRLDTDFTVESVLRSPGIRVRAADARVLFLQPLHPTRIFHAHP